jgi:hypothetical protein
VLARDTHHLRAAGEMMGIVREDARSTHPTGYGRQLILCTGAPERQLIASPETVKPCFS